MFLIGKILAFAESPVWWLFLGLLWLCWVSRKSGNRQAIWVFTWLFWLISYAPLANWALDAWQIPLRPWPIIKQPYPVAIILGGFTNPDPKPDDRVYTGRGTDRYFHGLELYQRGIVKQLLLTGGVSKIKGKFASEASQMRYLYQQAQVPDTALLLEPKARTTADNAAYSKVLLDSVGLGQDSLILVTSAWHMRRALACFRYQGLKVIPFGVDPQATEPENISWLSVAPSSDAWRKWEILIHEIIGLVTYKITGKA